MVDPDGPSGLAIASLTSEQIHFLASLPKAELHAHLNGCIPLNTLRSLAAEYLSNASLSSNESDTDDDVKKGEEEKIIKDVLERLSAGVKLDEIGDFFGLFPAIYTLTSTPDALAKATNAVLDSFLEARPLAFSPSPSITYPDCTYLELRTTPRSTPHMSRRQYLITVLEQIQKRGRNAAALIVSTDRRMDVNTVRECVDLAVELKTEGWPIVRLCTPFALFGSFKYRTESSVVGV